MCSHALLAHRFQDRPAARLYEAAGYAVVKEDVPIVVLIGQDRRKLLRKKNGAPTLVDAAAVR